MANKGVSTPIVRELLDKDNYNDWSVQVKTYLVAQDLWDVVKADQAPHEAEAEALTAWRKKNAAALHAIQISCSSDVFSVIREISSAKSAWDTLVAEFEKKPLAEINDQLFTNQTPSQSLSSQIHAQTEFTTKKVQRSGNFSVEEDNVLVSKELIVNINAMQANENNAQNVDYDCFFNDVGKGSWTTVREFLTLHPDAVRVTSPIFGWTALHVAVTFGHLHIVEELVNLMTPQDLEIQQIVLGQTAFEMAVGKGNIPMAKCMVEKNQNLFCIVNSSGVIPIAIAVNHGQKQMARYLYHLTLQQEVLLSDNGKHGADLMSKSIYNNMFDIVLDLISRHPHLTNVKDTISASPLDALTFRPTLFPSGCQLKFWQQWIYNGYTKHENKHVVFEIANQTYGSVFFVVEL
ncbi:hypothetical protein UlMin_004734, partial [Ulmus minor]